MDLNLDLGGPNSNPIHFHPYSYLESLLAILACRFAKEACMTSKTSNLVGGETEEVDQEIYDYHIGHKG